MFHIVFDWQVVKDIQNLKAAGLDKKAKNLIEIIRQDPFQKPSPYEKLVGNLKNFYSRRINIQHRIVYWVYLETIKIDRVEYNGTVKIIRMWTNYDKVRK